MVSVNMSTKAQWEQRQQAWASWREWESAQALNTFPPDHVFAALGTILEWLPEDVRQRDPDPEKTGIGRMNEIIATLSRAR